MKKRIYCRPISVTLSETMFQHIHEIAEKEEVSMSEVIREAIQENLDRTNNKYNYKQKAVSHAATGKTTM